MNTHFALIDRIKLCWAILSNKEFYAAVVVSRYSDGSPLGIRIYSNGKDTITYCRKLIESLKDYIKYYKKQ